MAWNATIPQNDELLVNFPALCRANWAAIALGTDAALQTTNAKVAAAAAIVDTKLAQITTPAKVSGVAITLLTSLPAGAGVIPDANSPHKLKADAGDTTPQYLDSLINTTMFEISATDLLELKDGGTEAEKLEGGSGAPGNWKFYGTDGAGAFGFRSPDHGNLAGLADDDHTQYLKTASFGATFVPVHDADDHSGFTVPNLSNVVFCFGGGCDRSDSYGYYVGTSNPGVFDGTRAFWFVWATTYYTILRTKFKKIAGISTITFYAYMKSNGSGIAANCKIDIGGANATASTSSSHTDWQWCSAAITVSGLSDGSVYDVLIQLAAAGATSSNMAYVIGIAS